MRIAIISDIHGNRIAFQEILPIIEERVDIIYNLGDAVGYLPDGNSVLDILLEKKIESLKGNHEAMLLNEIIIPNTKKDIYKLNEFSKSFNENHYSFIKALPEKKELFIDNTKLLLVHGSPLNYLTGYVYYDTDISYFNNFEYDFFFLGHTHRPFIKKFGSKTVVNVGSIGLPRDGSLTSSFVFFDTLNKNIDIIKIPLDTEKILSSYKTIHYLVAQKFKNNY